MILDTISLYIQAHPIALVIAAVWFMAILLWTAARRNPNPRGKGHTSGYIALDRQTRNEIDYDDAA